jgi:hypothetical protein
MVENLSCKLNAACISVTLLVAVALATGCQSKDDVAAIDSTLPDISPATEALEITPVTDPQAEPATSDSPDETETLTEAEQRGQLAKLSPKQVKQLLELESTSPNRQIEGLPVIVPAYIPEGFFLHHFQFADESYYQSADEYNPDGIYDYYSVGYVSADGEACFWISHGAYDGEFGDGPVEVETIEGVNAPSLDIEFDIGYVTFNREETPEYIISSLGGEGPQFYTLVSPSDCEKGIPLAEFRKVAKSLQYLDASVGKPLDVYSNICQVGIAC